MKNILEIIKDDPYLGVATFGSMGWQMDNFAHEYIYNRLKQMGFNTEDYEKWEATIICSALMAAICHESSVDDPYDMDLDLSADSCEILVHAMIHPENIATIINIEQGWKLVTTHERMENILAGYMFTNKQIKGITRRYINDLEVDPDHTHVVILQDVSISPALIGEFNIDDFNIEIQTKDTGPDDGYDVDEDDEYEEYDDYDEDDDEDEEEVEGGWVDYNYDQIDDIIDGMISTTNLKTDFLGNFWELFTVSKQDASGELKNLTPHPSQSHDNQIDDSIKSHPKSRINSNHSSHGVSKLDGHDIRDDVENPFYKFINEMKFS